MRRICAICPLIVLLWTVHAGAADTLVVCPAQVSGGMAPWANYRQGQGHELSVIEPPRSAQELHAAVRGAAQTGGLKYVVLVGDVGDVPTDYARAKVQHPLGQRADDRHGSVVWRSRRLRDGRRWAPDVAVGRIPVDSAEELAGVVRKLIRYEQPSDDGAGRRRIDVVAGVGGFGMLTDALIEAAARNVFRQVVPSDYAVRQLKTDPDATCEQISAGSFAWIYLGHGLPTMLDVAKTPRGLRPILSAEDVPRIRCEANAPLAVLVACYTGAIDARDDSLAERLVLNERGPVAAIAATRVTMPYGNAVFGCELLRAAFSGDAQERGATLGDIWLQAQRQTIASASAEDSLRTSLDSLARGVSPPPVDLAAERREHVLLYQLLGDPLTQIRYPAAEVRPPARIAAAPNEPTVK